MIQRKDAKLEPGMLVQLNPEKVTNPMFAACIMVVTEPTSWGCKGYVQTLGENGLPGSQAYYRAQFEEIEFVGYAIWISK